MYLTAPGGGAGLCQYAVPVSGQILAGVAAGLVQAGDVFYPPGVSAAHALWAAGSGGDPDVFRSDCLSGVGSLPAPLLPAGV